MFEAVKSLFRHAGPWIAPAKPKGVATSRQLRHECLEDRRVPAIVWVNRGSDNFDAVYGANAAIARRIADRAISDWNEVILDFNYDGDGNEETENTFTLNLSAAASAFPTERGATSNIAFTIGQRSGIPVSAFISMDDNGGGPGWYFDPTPEDDAEFVGFIDSYAASFVDTTQNNLNYADFYTSVLKEIGHAVGITTNQNSRLATFFTNGGDDQVSANPLDQLKVVGSLVTLTTEGGGSIYEGPPDPQHPNAPVTPNDLMNPDRTLLPAGANPVPIQRRFISDLDGTLLLEAYGYGVFQPSRLNMMHAVLDPLSGTLLVQGQIDEADTITVQHPSLGGGQFDFSTVRVTVNGLIKEFATGLVSQIVICGNGGNDTISGFTGNNFQVPVKQVHYVVSTNLDSADAGASSSDQVVDIDPNAPGRQTPLRAAVIDANGSPANRGIFVPRGVFKLTLSGTEPANTFVPAVGDLDITKSMSIVGSGPGSTIIDASTLATRDRIFEINGTGALDLARITLTGGRVTNGGGAIRVVNNGSANVTELKLTEVAIVGNTADSSAHTGIGGGILLQPGAAAQIVRSVITNNTAMTTGGGGGIYANGNQTLHAAITLDRTIVANNTSNQAPNLRSAGPATQGTFASIGGNLFNNLQGTLFLSPSDPERLDYIGPVDYVVTNVVDTFNHADDATLRSIREAVDSAMSIPGNQTIFLPAWDFFLTRFRTETQPPGETIQSTGDMDINNTVTIRGSGVEGNSTVFWQDRPLSLPAPDDKLDAVFDLVGDFDGDGSIDTPDILVWQQSVGSTTDNRGDANGDGVVNTADLNLWKAGLGQAPVINVFVQPRPLLSAPAVAAGSANDSAALTAAPDFSGIDAAAIDAILSDSGNSGKRTWRPGARGGF